MDLTNQKAGKSLKIPPQKIFVDDYISEAARKILNRQFKRMIKHEQGTRLGADTKELHDMRVATRRMRVAFEIFEPFFKRKTIKPYTKGLRSTARALGRVRDLDVFLEELNAYLKTVPENEHAGYKMLFSQWSEEHNNARLKMLTFLDSERYQIFTQQFSRFLNTSGAGAKQLEIGQPNRVRGFAPKLISARFATVQSHERGFKNATIKEFHALRIDLKKLRYTVEFFCDLLNPEHKDVIRNIKILQDHLGNLNDADVACQMVNRFMLALENHERLNPESMYIYLAKKEDERDRLFSTFPQLWQRVMKGELNEKLAKAISAF